MADEETKAPEEISPPEEVKEGEEAEEAVKEEESTAQFAPVVSVLCWLLPRSHAIIIVCSLGFFPRRSEDDLAASATAVASLWWESLCSVFISF